MNEMLALTALMLWPGPHSIFIPLHLFLGFWRRVGLWTYAALFALWGLLAGLAYYSRDFLLAYFVDVGALYYPGVAFLAGGLFLQAWASHTIGIRGTFGWWELFPRKTGFAVSGPYKHLKHPIYFSHSLMLFGAFLITGVLSVGVSFILDILLVNLVIKPLEERELAERFGKEGLKYKRRVQKLFPRV